MTMPCKECLVFPCCRNRAVYGNGKHRVLRLWMLIECEIFEEWYIGEDCPNTKSKDVLNVFIKVKDKERNGDTV